jgi:membrane associated rhomboid family serine protease
MIFNQLLILLGINLALPFIVSGIAWEAHVGGLAAGALIAAAWDRVPRGASNPTASRVGFAAGVAVAAILVLIFL